MKKRFTQLRPESSKSLEGDVDELISHLYEKYWMQVERRCQCILRNENEAADATQEVFLKVLQNRDKFRGSSKWMTWIYRITTNLCIDRLRARTLRDQNWEQQVQMSIPAEYSQNHDISIDLRELFTNVFSRCDKMTQQIAMYAFFDELHQHEIAELMEISRVTVNKKLGRLRELIAEAQKEWEQ